MGGLGIKETLKRIIDSEYAKIVNIVMPIFMLPVWYYLIKANWAESVLLSASFFLVIQICLIQAKSSEINKNVSTDHGKLGIVSGGVNTIKDDVDKLAVSITELRAITDYRKIVVEDLAEAAQNLNELSETKSGKFFGQWYSYDVKKLKKHVDGTKDYEFVRFAVYKLQDATHPIHNIFKEEQLDFFYGTCTCKGINWWLNQYGGDFVKFIHNNIKNETIEQNGTIKQVRRIFIYENDEELHTTLVKFAFILHNNEVYKFKVISRKKFNEEFPKGETNTYKEDFGIFDEAYVWEVTHGDEKDGPTSGNFSRNKTRVKWYKEFFEKLWTKKSEDYNISYIELKIASKCAKKNITDLSNLYEEYERENENESKDVTTKYDDTVDYGY